ncbi:UDPGT domain containing protein [Asbolus verrucosus]|uniref:UDPGT domain containing protein n=1 Tax=Asbolus verrucosus TaxID=1661398 RepID=A0A482VE65_ASBVE|nr:UDPGT domain containing protein [Asbolus verrucosus]
MGLAVKVAYEKISRKTILQAAKKLLENPIYKQNAERASKQFKDRPMSPVDTAIYWVEYVIRHKGAPQLRTTVALTSSINFPRGSDRIGNLDNPSYIATYFTPSTDKMSLDERIENTILLISSKFFCKQIAKGVARQFKDRPLSPLDTAIYRVES